MLLVGKMLLLVSSTPTDKPAAPRRRRRLLRLVPILALILVFAYQGWRRQGTVYKAGDGSSGTISPAAAAQVRTDGRFRVGIYNIDGALGKDDPAAIARIGQIISDTDICGLAEVRSNASNRKPNQAQLIADPLGRAWLFAPAERRFWMDGVGNGVVSRLPVTHWDRLPLPSETQPDSHRNMVLLRTMIGDRTVRVIVTHIDRGAAHAEQISAVTQFFQGLPAPVVLLADLNADLVDPEMQPLLTTPGVVDPIARFVGVKERRVDWILARGLKAVDAGKTEDPVSDHIFFWADFQLPPAAAMPATVPATRPSTEPVH
jgi:endonuclease/exonuclease/phosphatase family metal-dependent hydrolase